MEKYTEIPKQASTEVEVLSKDVEMESTPSEAVEVTERMYRGERIVTIKVTTQEPEIKSVIDEGYNDIGMPFIAYMLLPDIDPSSPSLLKDFDSLYAGEYTSRKEVAESWFECLGFAETIRATIKHEGIPEETVITRPEAMMSMIKDLLDLVEIGGRIYAFYK